MSSQGGGGGGGVMGLLPFILMFVILYLLLIRPQQKKHRVHQQMLQTLKKGDRVLTTGGLFGTVVGIKENENIVVLRLAENVKVEVQKGAISAKISKED
ncbi:preprotein translocase subunit YajC [bacterium]|nr:preprotein translocase subunit YajC [bacterium]